MDYQRIKRFQTMQGVTVEVARSSTGELVVVKRAEVDSEVSKLAEYARHLGAMHRLLGEESIYPPILYCDERLLVLTFYPYGSLDDIEDRELLQCLAAKAIDNLFRIAAIEAPNLPNPEERQTQSRTFLADEPRIRLRRLRRALRDDPAARAWADGSSLDGHPIRSLLFDYLTSWITDDSTEYPLSRIAAPSLGLAAHGDFGFNNVLLADPASRDATLAFIDTRGRWYRGIPWWDPIMDIATLLAFHCRIDPALSEYGGAGLGRRVDLEESRLSEGEIMGLCLKSRAFRAWSSHDSHWAARLEIYLAVRLLGSVSAQFMVAPEPRAKRATAVLGLYAQQMEKVWPLLR